MSKPIRDPRKMIKYLCLFALAGLAMIVLGVVMGYRTASFIARAERTTATVVEVDSRASGSGSDRTYYPTIRFHDTDGNEHTVESPHGSSRFNFAEGAEVAIYFDPENPEQFRFNSLLSLWGMAVVPTVVGAGLLGLAGLAIWRIRQSSAKDSSPEAAAEERA